MIGLRRGLGLRQSLGLDPEAIDAFFSGGFQNGAPTVGQTTVYRVPFATGVPATVAGGALTTGRADAAGFSRPGVAAYTAGGRSQGQPGNGVGLTSIEKLIVATTTRSTLGATLRAAYGRNSQSTKESMPNGSVAAYVGGGQSEGASSPNIPWDSPAVNTQWDKLAIPTETRSTITVTGTGDMAASDPGAAGIVRPYAPANAVSADNKQYRKLVFATEVASSLAASVSNAPGRQAGASASRPKVAAYYAGGDESTTGSTGVSNRIDKFAYPTNVTSMLAATTNAQARGVTGGSYNDSFAHFAGGTVIGNNFPGTNTSRFTFATETAAASTALPATRAYTSGASV